ncbi:hypothetical protein ACHMW5_13380 [Azospirillum melinis]|uniref:hypothetical protein n=1 Tax=Azospirillum melinis TaxID=328839 RepID=UPI0037573C07
MADDLTRYRLPDGEIVEVAARYYLCKCQKCGWTGSSEECGSSVSLDGDGDISCPECYHADCEEIDAPIVKGRKEGRRHAAA